MFSLLLSCRHEVRCHGLGCFTHKVWLTAPEPVSVQVCQAKLAGHQFKKGREVEPDPYIHVQVHVKTRWPSKNGKLKRHGELWQAAMK